MDDNFGNRLTRALMGGGPRVIRDNPKFRVQRKNENSVTRSLRRRERARARNVFLSVLLIVFLIAHGVEHPMAAIGVALAAPLCWFALKAFAGPKTRGRTSAFADSSDSEDDSDDEDDDT